MAPTGAELERALQARAQQPLIGPPMTALEERSLQALRQQSHMMPHMAPPTMPPSHQPVLPRGAAKHQHLPAPSQPPSSMPPSLPTSLEMQALQKLEQELFLRQQ